MSHKKLLRGRSHGHPSRDAAPEIANKTERGGSRGIFEVQVNRPPISRIQTWNDHEVRKGGGGLVFGWKEERGFQRKLHR